MSADNPLAFDPFDPAQTQNQWEQLARLRREAPVSRPLPGFVYVARHADVKAVFRDAETFSSREGFRGPGVVVPEEESFLGEMDPPAHPRLRGLLMHAFRPGLERRAAEFTREFTERKLEALAEAGGGDLVSGLGIHLPAAVTAYVLGIPTEHIERVGHWGFELLHSTWPEKNATERGEGLEGAFPDFAHFLDEQISMRRRSNDPPDDLITRMVRANEKGRILSSVQIRTLCANCLLASQSTANLIGNLLHRFLSDEQFALDLNRNRKLLSAAIEESLRFEPPVLFLFRTAKRDTEIGGYAVREGERIILGIASGNRDESVYERADEFWLRRGWPDVPEHLTFGPGPHLCLGNQLARMEARIVLETMIDRFEPGSVRLAPDYRREFVPMFLEYGPERLDAVFDSPMLPSPIELLEAVEVPAAAPVSPPPESEPAPESEPDFEEELEFATEVATENAAPREPLDDFLAPPGDEPDAPERGARDSADGSSVRKSQETPRSSPSIRRRRRRR